MLTMKPVRRHGDNLNEEASIAAATDASEGDTARQEFRDEADINTILRKFGVNSFAASPGNADIDYTLDLQSALATIYEVQDAHRRMPEALRAKYPTWRHLISAIEDGTYEPLPNTDKPPTVPTPAPTPTPTPTPE